MPTYQRGNVRIHYEEAGSGFPLMIIPGGGLNSTEAQLRTHPFDPFKEFAGAYRVIAADLRNANGGQSTGPLEVDRPWDAYTDDHLGLMDHLGIRQFAVIGFCIGGPFIWNLLKRAPDRVASAVLAQPSGWRSTLPTASYDNNMKGWGPQLCANRPDIKMEQVSAFLRNMYTGGRADFVYTVTRDFVRQCQTPVLIMPDDVPGHPYVVAMESAHLAPNAQVTLYPWKANPEQTQIALRHVNTFLKANTPAAAVRPLATAAK
jgi:pimeloyl-ACP methyl ester carboxylesterase